MNTLVHVCCGPCSMQLFNYLKQKGIKVSAFFYNPNIHPKSEYLLRYKTAKEFLIAEKIKFIGSDYNQKEYFSTLKGEKKFGKRCLKCWQLRLEKTARKAKEAGYNTFCSTLQVSHFQDQEALNKIGKRLAKKYKIEFLEEKFENLFRVSQKKAKKKGLYRQNYCGCVFSLRERYEEKY